MPAEAVIDVRNTDPRLILPSAAIASRGGNKVVFTASGSEPATAQKREVELGRRVGNKTELLSGIEEGEEVIITGISGLSEGDPVDPNNTGMSGQLQ